MSGCSHRWQTPCVARWRYPQSFGWCSEQKQEVCPFQRQEALSNRQGRCSMALLSSLYLIPVSLSRQSGIGPHAQDQTQHRTLTRRLAVPLLEISSCSSGDCANPYLLFVFFSCDVLQFSFRLLLLYESMRHRQKRKVGGGAGTQSGLAPEISSISSFLRMPLSTIVNTAVLCTSSTVYETQWLCVCNG